MMDNHLRGFAMPIVVVIVVAALAFGGAAYYANQSRMEADKIAQTEKEEMTERKDGSVIMEEKTGEIVEIETAANYFGDILAGNSAPLLDFMKADYDAALKSDKLIVLYFYANWCPICKAEFPIMKEVFNGLTTDEVIGFRVNYSDNQTDNDEKNLAREFGIAYQHTKVFVKNGQRILKSPEGWGKSRYESEISKILNQ